jgi:hypothetical protein
MTGAGGERRAVLGTFMSLALTLAIGACEKQSTAPVTSTPAAVSTSPSPAAASVKPSASPDAGRVAMAKFVTLATSDGFAYQATFTGESRHTVDLLPISKGLLQVNGDNVRVQATFRFRTGTRVAVEHRSVGGKGWLRYGSEPWRRMAEFGPANSMAAFAAVHGAQDVTYVGPVKTSGKTLFEVSIPSAIVNPIMIPAGNLSEVAVTDSKLALRIDGEGRPVSGTGRITGRGRVSGQLQEIVIDLKLTFLKVGQKMTITAP